MQKSTMDRLADIAIIKYSSFKIGIQPRFKGHYKAALTLLLITSINMGY